MHFRLRGNSVQIVKTVTDQATGKARSTPVGSANLITGKLNAGAQAALTEAEVVEVQEWLARHRDLEQRKAELEFATLAGTLNRLTTWLRDADPAVVAGSGAEVTEALRYFRAALNRRLKAGEV